MSHPSLPAWLRSKQVAASILTEQHNFLQHLADAGGLSEGHMTVLRALEGQTKYCIVCGVRAI